ncbi:protein kinase [Gemmatimonadota bacterium]
MPDDVLERVQAALADRYTIDRELGAGGMATVHLAEDLKHHRKVAIKVLRPELAASIGADRFLREIEIAANLTHPHILPLHDSGEADGFLYYVMPYIEGESLRDRLLRERQLPIDDALTLTREVASALAYAHEQGVIHRDIKPENIMLSAGGAVVADFGIARALSAAGGEQLTETGMAVGTPAYMSPEQASADKIDARSDIYSLGCVLYEMLGGDPPFLGTTPQAILARKAAEPAPPLRAVRDTVPEGLELVVLKSLARTPADRFSTAAEFRAALEPASLELAATRPSRAQPRRPWRWIAAVAATAAMAVILTLLGVRGGNSGTPLRYASLATLTIANLTGDTSWDEQVVGLTAELHTSMVLLSHDGGVSQRSLRAVRSAEAEANSSQEIAERLGVQLLLEPNLVSTPSGVKMSVALVEGHSGTQLWAADFNRPFPEVRQLNRDIALAVAAEIGLVLDPETMVYAPTSQVDSVAYRHYLTGRTLYEENLREDNALRFTASDVLPRTMRSFEASIEADSMFAPPWAGLATIYLTLGGSQAMSPEEAYRRGAEYAQRALQLDPESPAAIGISAVSAWWTQMRWDDAGQGLRRTLELDPINYEALYWGSFLFSDLGLSDEALTYANRLVETNPGSAGEIFFASMICLYARDYDCTVRLADSAASLEPGRADVCLGRALGLSFKGEHQEAVRSIEACATDDLDWGVTHAIIKTRSGNTADARSWLSQRPPNHWGTAVLFGQIGELDSAFVELEARLDLLGFVERLPSQPYFDPLRGDPRIDAALRRMNLECEYYEDGSHSCRDIGTSLREPGTL